MASLLGNVALLTVFVRDPAPAVAATADSVSAANPAQSAAAEKSADPKQSATTVSAAVAGPSTWLTLTAGNLDDIVARLRAAGISPRMLRAIISALVQEQFANRHKAIADALRAKPWWNGPFDSFSDPQILALRRQLTRETRLAFNRAVGTEEPENDYDRLYQQRRYGIMSADKIRQVREINADYADLAAEVRANAKGIILPEDRDKLAYLEQQKQADIAKLLTPDELFEMQLRSSPTAKAVRQQLAAFDPTEEEFRAIFKIQQGIDTQFGSAHVQDLTQDERRQRRDLINDTSDQVRAVLTPERFAEYQLKTDPAYRPTNDLVSQLSLSPAVTAQVMALQRETRARMQALVADRSMAQPDRIAQFAALSQQVSTTLTAALGATGATQYKQMPVGNWVNNLDSRARPPAARPKN